MPFQFKLIYGSGNGTQAVPYGSFLQGFPAEGVQLLLDGLVFLPELGGGAKKLRLQGTLDAGVSHIEQLITAEAILFIAQSHALQTVVGDIAPVDGKIVGTGGELDMGWNTLFLVVDQPEPADLPDLSDGNFSHKASPFDMIAQLPGKSKCFSRADRKWDGFFMFF